MINSLRKKEVLPGDAVGIINIGYKHHIPELYEHLPFLQRNCLHVIYERLRIADEILSLFKRDFISAIQEKIIHDPWEYYAEHLKEILNSYGVVEDLIKDYLDGKPKDVFYVKNES